MAFLALLAFPATAMVVVSPDIKIRPPTRPTAPATAPAAPPARSPAVPSSAPLLTRTEQLRLAKDGEVQRKDRRGRGGQCVHVVETDAPLDDVWQRLRNVDGWADLMRGIKTSKTREWDDAGRRAGGRATRNAAMNGEFARWMKMLTR